MNNVTTSERWIDVLGYEGIYLVSDLGNIRHVPAERSHGRNLIQRVDDHGRPYVSLYRNKRPKGKNVCRVVAESFHGPCPDGMECAHNDGNAANNIPGNLRWDTHKNNNDDKKAHGTEPLGEQRPFAKLTADKVMEIDRRVSAGESQRKMAAEMNVHPVTLHAAYHRKKWKHVPKAA